MSESNVKPVRAIDADVAIVGAGTTGLACALVLARRGHRVIVLEARLDSHTDSGRAELASAAALLADAHDQPIDLAASAFKQVRRARNRYWATSERNVLLDEHTQKYLKELGIEVALLPELQSIEFCGVPGGPKFVTELSGRQIHAEANGLHVRRMIYQRNWSSLVPLSMLQHLLRSAVDHHPQIELRFGQQAINVAASDDGVTLTTAAAESIESGFLLIADGGGRQSLQQNLNLHRTVDHAEVVNFGVFESGPDISLFGRPTETVFSYNALLSDGWIGVFCTGSTFSIAVNSVLSDGSPAPTAEERLAEIGVSGTRLVEPPLAIRVEVGQLDQFHQDDRILFAGDAAVSGNPRFGLGVQFGLVWAQALARAADQGLLSTEPEAALAAYTLEGARIASERRQYELPWLAMLDATVEDEGNFVDAAMSAAVFESMLDFEIALSPEGSKRQIRFRTVFDFCQAAASSLEPLAHIFTQIGYAELETDLFWALNENGGTACIEPTRTVSFQMGTEKVLLNEGTLRVLRIADGWEFTLSDARALLISEPDSDEAASRSEADMAISHLSMQVPDRFIDQLMIRLPHRLPELGLFSDDGIRLDITLREGQTFSWGPLRIRFSQAPKLQMHLRKQTEGAVVMSLAMIEGRMEPLSMTRFSRETGLSSARWLVSFSTLTRGVFDSLLDSWASLIGRQVSRVDFRLKSDGSALATFGPGVGVSIYLSAHDVQQLQDQLLKAATMAELMPQYQQGVVGLQTVAS